MTCRACGFDHKPTVRCEIAARIRASNAVVNTDDAVVNTVPVNLGAYTPGCGAPVFHGPPPVVTITTTKRQTAWQQANREKYNAKMRDFMRTKRAKTLPT